jgi:hypothetical protein
MTEHDRKEIAKFKEFLRRWNLDKVEVLSDPDMQAYLNITPLEAKAMSEALQWVARPGKPPVGDDPTKCPICQGMPEIDCPRCD